MKRFRAATVLLALLTMPAATRPAAAAWPHDPLAGNLPVCTATGHQLTPAAISDGANGAIIVWTDYRAGATADLYAQRVSAAGVPLWTANGVVVTTAANDQTAPALVSDGAGGVIIAWADMRGGVTRDLYAQRLNAAGAPQWTANGVAVCTAANHQDAPTIASDGAGGAIVTWSDLRGGATYDIYAQRLNPAGAAQWAANGVAVCAAANSQVAPVIATDGAGGAFVVWQDLRGGVAQDLYAQHLSPAGAPQWTIDGLALCTAANSQITPAIISDGAGGAIVAWTDNRNLNFDIFAQRMNAAGTMYWGVDGTPLCTTTATQQSAVLASDGAGGAIVAWGDFRNSGSPDIYAQRVDATGATRWGFDGYRVYGDIDDQNYPSIVADGAGGAVIGWRDYRSIAGYDVYAQHMTASGSPLWSIYGNAVSAAEGDQEIPVAVPDGAGGAIFAWTDSRSGATNYDIYAQRIENFGKLGSPEPSIASVLDVPNDQGGRVRLAWDASYLDSGNDPDLTAYDIFHSVPPNLARAAITRGASRPLKLGEVPVSGERAHLFTGLGAQQLAWEYVSTVSPQHFVATYGSTQATTGDSVAASNPSTSFMVVGRNAAGSMYWLSAPAAGYSVDNLPPAAPAPFTGQYAAGATSMHWNPNLEADLAGYRLYRGTSLGFQPGAGNLLASLTLADYTDPAGSPYVYKLTAIDSHGNESAAATLIPGGTTGVDGATARELSLSAPSPNPARRLTALRYTLSRAGHVRLSVYDAAGRRVRVVRDGALEAGAHTDDFTLRDRSEHALASGRYLVRLEAEGRVLTRRLAAIE